MPLTFATATHTGLVRRGNEDSFYARPPVFVVADGMGGAQAGEVASAMAVQVFEHFYPQPAEPEGEMARLISRVNKSIFEYAMSDQDRTGMGTTITAAAVSGNSVAIAHVGDSRAWLFRQGSLSRLTEDHSLVAEMVRRGQITEEEAAHHPQRSIITRALGVEGDVKVDSARIDWLPGDIFLLASDGLYGMVPEAEIAATLARGRDLRDTAADLIEAANAQGGSDNITVVLFSPDGSVPGMDTATHGASGSLGAGPLAAVASGSGGRSHLAGSGRKLSVGGIRAALSSLQARVVIGVLAAVIIAGGAWFGLRFVYFVGLDGNQVSIFQGVPYDLGPVPLYSLYRTSPVSIKDLEKYEQDRVLAQNLQSKGGAEQMLDNLLITSRQRREEQWRVLQQPGSAGGTGPSTSTTSTTGVPRAGDAGPDSATAPSTASTVDASTAPGMP